MIPAIEIENISKSYTINHEQKASSGNATFRDAMYAVAQKPLELLAGKKLQKEEFRALDNISFEVMPGEVMGIVGRNGSGKSTLLKILSRIAEPTSGRVTMRGKVASLLEVGTGFHPELTGRENVFFNGAILGMSQKEIKDKFNDIVEFSEVEKFLDTPVKFYSSGMYVRLAFAVAAHLDTDILIVDEVLAVGDAAFQKKCIGKMNSVARDGRTVLFVSHNANAIQQLCSRAVYLDGGKMVSIGDTDSVLKEYFTSQNLTSGTSSWENKGKYKHDNFTPLSFRLCNSTGEIIDKAVGNDDDVFVEISGDIKKPDELLTVGYALYAEDGECLYWSYATDGEKTSWPKIKTGKNIMRSALPKRLLNEGNYRLELIASLHFKEWILEPGVTSPSINLDIKSGFSPSPYYLTRRPSILAPILEWEVRND